MLLRITHFHDPIIVIIYSCLFEISYIILPGYPRLDSHSCFEMLRAKTVDSARFCTQRRIEVFNFNEDRIKIIRKESRVWIPNPPSPLIRCLGCLLQRINRNRCTDSQTSNRVILFTLSLSLSSREHGSRKRGSIDPTIRFPPSK